VDKEEKDMGMLAPNKDSHQSSSSQSGLQRLKQIAGKAMKKGEFTIEDVRKDLEKLRSTYK
jgi:hypothetical protein